MGKLSNVELQRQAGLADLGQGEYGANLVAATAGGTSTRLVFGTETPLGPRFYLAVHITPEARASLIEQLQNGAE